MAIGVIEISNSRCVSNEDCQIGDDDALLVNENQVCGSGTQRLKENGAFILRLNLDDIRAFEQHSFVRSLKHDSGPGVEFKRDARGRSLKVHPGSDRSYRIAGDCDGSVVQHRKSSKNGKDFPRIHRAFS
jgi:hypothetical protein